MAKHKIDIKGVIIPNSYKWFYEWFDEDSTCPRDVQQVIDASAPGDDIDVYINSTGGVIDSGSEIYTILRTASQDRNIETYITGLAASAASVIACATHSQMSPTALMMVHCVSSDIHGNHIDMEKEAEILRTADEALCSAYVGKTGMSKEDALQLMENETWLNAEQAKEYGLVDGIMFEDPETDSEPMSASSGMFKLPTKDQMDQARAMIGESRSQDDTVLGYKDAIKRGREMDAILLKAGRDVPR